MIVFKEAVDRAYRDTREKFEARKNDPAYLPYVVPDATSPHVGFAIFYTPATFRPKLLLVGQNPANFAAGQNLRDSPNTEMLSGMELPLKNTYIEHKHRLAKALQKGFARHPGLLADCVGMNVWHFQCVSRAESAPQDLLRFCECTTRSLVKAIQAKHILCLGRPAFSALLSQRVSDTNRAEVVSLGSSKLWYVPHPAGRPRSDFKDDLPVVLEKIERELSGATEDGRQFPSPE